MTEPLADIEKAAARIQLCSALAKDADTLVDHAINWYSCMQPNLSPTQIRRRQRLIRQAVGDYLYVAGSNLKAIVESLPDDYNQDLLARGAAEQLSKLVAQLYPELTAAMKRAGMTGRRAEKLPRKRFATTQAVARDGHDRSLEGNSVCIEMETV